MKRIESRLRSLEENAAARDTFVFLGRDELPVAIVMQCRATARRAIAAQARGEALPACVHPARAALWERLRPSYFACCERVDELQRAGQLQAVVESLKRKGAWRNEWDDQESIGEAGSETA